MRQRARQAWAAPLAALLLAAPIVSVGNVPASAAGPVDRQRDGSGARAAVPSESEWPELSAFLQTLVGTYTAPAHVNDAFTPNGPIMGNGDMHVVLVGDRNEQTFSISQSDMWTDDGTSLYGVHAITTGGVTVRPVPAPSSPVATFKQEQFLLDAKVNATSEAGFKTSTFVSADENTMITELQATGSSAVPVAVDTWAKADNVSYPAAAGVDAGTLWATRESTGDSAAEFTFTGTAVQWIGPKNTNGGKADVYIDGGLAQADIDTYTAAGKQHQQVLYSRTGLAAGSHTIKVVATGTKNPAASNNLIAIDAFRFTPASGAPVTVDDRDAEVKYSGSWGDYADGANLNTTERFGGNHARWTTRNAIATRISGASATYSTPSAGKSTATFTLNPGATVKIYTVLAGGKDTTAHLADAKTRVGQVTDSVVDDLRASHVEWWKQYWLKSHLRTFDDVLDKWYYGSLYQWATVNRSGHTPVGQYPFNLGDFPGWSGDYHMNQEYMNQNSGFYSSNRSELLDGVYDPLLDFMDEGRVYAQTKMQSVHPTFEPADGILFPVGLGPFGADASGAWFGDQVSNASYTGALFVWQYYYFQDLEWLRTEGYPFVDALGDFWISHLGEKVDGKYVDYGATMEHGYGTNPGLDVGLIKFVMRALLKMSTDLGVDADKRATWQDIYDNISPFPTAIQNGKEVFVGTEEDTQYQWYFDMEGPIWPGENVTLSSPQATRQIAFNTLDIAQWNAPKFGVFANRVGYPIADAITRLKQNFINTAPATWSGLRQNFTIGGAHYNGSYLEFINTSMLQSHEGFIRIFPNWYPDKPAEFHRLRAVGAFLVDGEQTAAGVIQNVRIHSEKGKQASIKNPWPGYTLQVKKDGIVVDTTDSDGVYTFPTTAGSTYEVTRGTAAETKVDDRVASLVSTGAWTNWTDAADYLGTEKYSNQANAWVEWTFTGTSVKWVSAKNANGGKADVYLDGVLSQAGIDTYNADSKLYQSVLFTKTGLSPGTHTIRVVVTGTKNPSSSNTYIVSDAFISG